MNDWLPVRQYLPVTAPVTNGTTDRRPDNLEAVVSQFPVETHPRYRPGDGFTWCNIFVWDVTRALACEVPHWWLRDELSANLNIGWLGLQGASHGWSKVTREESVTRANCGFPTLVTYAGMAGGRGHIAVMLPGGFIAQAGASNFQRAPLASGFGSLPVDFWSHP